MTGPIHGGVAGRSPRHVCVWGVAGHVGGGKVVGMCVFGDAFCGVEGKLETCGPSTDPEGGVSLSLSPSLSLALSLSRSLALSFSLSLARSLSCRLVCSLSLSDSSLGDGSAAHPYTYTLPLRAGWSRTGWLRKRERRVGYVRAREE